MANIGRPQPDITQGSAKQLPFCGCFGSSLQRDDLPSRPRSAPAKPSAPANPTGQKFAADEVDEAWRIGSQVPEPVEVQPSTAVLPLSTNVTPRCDTPPFGLESLRKVGGIHCLSVT